MTATLVRPTTPVHPSATSPIATALTFVVIAAATIASVGGLAVYRLYTDDTAWATAALRGGDLVTLVLIVPGLIAAALLARRARCARSSSGAACSTTVSTTSPSMCSAPPSTISSYCM